MFAAVALACITSGVSGTDLLAYLLSTAIVSSALALADAHKRNGRARNALDIEHVVASSKARKLEKRS